MMSMGLLILRLTVGLTLAAHGAQKLLGWFGGPGLTGTSIGMEHLGFVPGRRHAWMAGLTELAGGLLLGAGFLTPIAAAGVFAVMLVAGVSAHVKKGFFVQNGGYEYTLILGLSGLSMAFTGAGPVSIDALLGLHLAGAQWGVAALLIGLAGSAIQLVGRRTAPAASATPA